MDLYVCLLGCLTHTLHPGAWVAHRCPSAGNPLPPEDLSTWGDILLNSTNTWSAVVITVLVFHPW
jgi:hypothetical protein